MNNCTVYTRVSSEKLEAVHKRRPHKIAKNLHPPPSPQNAPTDSTSSTLVQKNEAKMRTSAFEDPLLPLVHKMSAVDNPLTADVFMNSPLSDKPSIPYPFLFA